MTNGEDTFRKTIGEASWQNVSCIDSVTIACSLSWWSAGPYVAHSGRQQNSIFMPGGRPYAFKYLARYTGRAYVVVYIYVRHENGTLGGRGYVTWSR